MQRNRLQRAVALLSFGICGALLHAAEVPRRIAPDVYVIAGTLPPNRQPDGNSVLLRGSGWIVIDTGRHIEHTQQIIEFAKASKLDIQSVLNTHWHLDHTGGNLLLREAFPRARVYASDALRGAMDGFLKNYREQLVVMLARAPNRPEAAEWQGDLNLIDSAERLAPDGTIVRSDVRSISGRRLSIHLERATVTAGDLWTEDVATETLIAGDLVTLPVPFFDTACPSRWNTALATIAARPFKILIPGHGRSMTKRQFEVYRRSFGKLLACADSSESKTTCIEGWSRDVGELLASDERERVEPMLTYYFDAILRAPNETRTKYCPRSQDSLDKN